MARYPALRILHLESDLALASVDDFGPVAVDEESGALRVFFAGAEPRDRAAAALRVEYPASDVTPIEVDDEGWARRSQANLPPITVGRVVVSTLEQPPSTLEHPPSTLHIVIRPSMGFGTGHHATTRLCLAALQDIDLAGKTVLDVGTGSGILAIAAAMLGARGAIGIDDDPDAVQAARENLALNPTARGVELITVDARTAALPRAEIVVANLTGAVIASAATILAGAVAGGGLLIVSGVMLEEESAVRSAFRTGAVVRRATEDEWVVLTLNFSSGTTV